MLFADVRNALIAVLRARVRNGELTERGLSRLVGVSQPHIHNVLKGTRTISPELSDQILKHLRLSLLDLIERERIEAHIDFSSPGAYVYVPILKGLIGPGNSWPTEKSERDRLPFLAAQAARIGKPVAVRLAEDVRMSAIFSEGDIALLDQSHRARTELESGAYYVVKAGSGGIVRRIRSGGGTLYLVPEDCLNRPAAWQPISLEGRQISQFVRARAYLANPVYEWT